MLSVISWRFSMTPAILAPTWSCVNRPWISLTASSSLRTTWSNSTDLVLLMTLPGCLTGAWAEPGVMSRYRSPSRPRQTIAQVASSRMRPLCARSTARATSTPVSVRRIVSISPTLSPAMATVSPALSPDAWGKSAVKWVRRFRSAPRSSALKVMRARIARPMRKNTPTLLSNVRAIATVSMKGRGR